ncbi:four helix bundle protein [Flaviaesturariibacter amylovorans]|uniref:Four helix bundle protein n=1 Tax=Flaviaesturariibacter amylovorans TaxID=1084520 RepID=A0ABP8G9H0_9BACT
MFLKLDHQEMDIYKATRAFVLSCYRLSKSFPVEEKFAMCQQLRRAALSVHLNVAEGASRKTAPDRKRFREIARWSLIEIDALLDIASDLDYCQKENLVDLGTLLVRCFQMLSKMMN